MRMLGAVAALALLGVACQPVGPPPPPPPPGSVYVALGDSYTAGPLIPTQLADPAGCLRSDHDYPHLAFPALGQAVLRDVSCSGATTADMTGSQNVSPAPNPPQLDALGAKTRIVSLGIGGNDIGFTEIIVNCITGKPSGTPCQDHYVVNGTDELATRVAGTAPKVSAVLAGIKVRAPHAKILVVGYPAILPDTGPGCFPQMPIAPNDVPYLRATQKRLNAMLSAQATAAGATYVDTYAPSIGHDACKAPNVRWVEPLQPVNPAAPVHPNLAGMLAISLFVILAVTG